MLAKKKLVFSSGASLDTLTTFLGRPPCPGVAGQPKMSSNPKFFLFRIFVSYWFVKLCLVFCLYIWPPFLWRVLCVFLVFVYFLFLKEREQEGESQGGSGGKSEGGSTQPLIPPLGRLSKMSGGDVSLPLRSCLHGRINPSHTPLHAHTSPPSPPPLPSLWLSCYQTIERWRELYR